MLATNATSVKTVTRGRKEGNEGACHRGGDRPRVRSRRRQWLAHRKNAPCTTAGGGPNPEARADSFNKERGCGRCVREHSGIRAEGSHAGRVWIASSGRTPADSARSPCSAIESAQ